MFTGIIETTGSVIEKCHYEKGFKVTFSHELSGLSLGGSIAVNGVCLTITRLTEKAFDCDVSPETIDKTTLGELVIGQAVSLESPLTLEKSVGGHFVLGHVDEILVLHEKHEKSEFTEMTFKGTQHPSWLVEKGSICIDGVSLTINKLEQDMVTCMIIPHTLEATHLRCLKIGKAVNVEYDYLAKLVAKQHSLAQNSLLSV